MKKHTGVAVEISKPCSQDWSDMQAAPGGKFCDHCQKRVVDFSSMSDAAVLSYLSNSTTSLCGRLDRAQLNRPIESTQRRYGHFWPQILATATLLLGLSRTANGQASRKIMGDTVIVDNRKFKTPTVPATNEDIPLTVRGTVVDMSQRPLQGVAVLLLDGQSRQQLANGVTDVDGNYQMSVPVSLPAGCPLSLKFIHDNSDTTAMDISVQREPIVVNPVLNSNPYLIMGGLSFREPSRVPASKWQKLKRHVRRQLR